MWLPRLDRTADTEPSRTDYLGRWKVASEKKSCTCPFSWLVLTRECLREGKADKAKSNGRYLYQISTNKYYNLFESIHQSSRISLSDCVRAFPASAHA